jgi:hypothetical protein
MDSSTDDVIETFDNTYDIEVDDDQIKDVDTDQVFDDVIETFDDTYGIGADDDQIKDVDTDQDFDENLNYESVLATIIEESPIDDDDDDDDDEDNKNDELIEWAQNIKRNHQHRIRDGDIYFWLQ